MSDKMPRSEGNLRAKREAAWVAACRHGCFTYHQVSADTSMAVETVAGYVKEWEQEGLVERLDERQGNHLQFRLTELARKKGVPAKISAAAAETLHGNMWRAIRGLPSFTALDIAAHATTPTLAVDERHAQEYCRMLAGAGYLRVMQKAAPGRKKAIYKLIRDTGPRPPRERRVRAVYDDNLAEFTHIARGLT